LQLYIKNENDIKAWTEVLDLHEVDGGQNLEIYIPYDAGVFFGTRTCGIGSDESRIPLVSDVQLYLDTINDPARGEELARYLRESKLRF
jgi:hypothetical protein